MKDHGTVIPSRAKALAQAGQLIEAIKVTREQTGISLKEAKDAIDAYLANPQSTSRTSRPDSRHQAGDIPLQAILFLEEGSLINAIKTTREAFHIELRPAREAVVDYLRRNSDLHGRYKSAAARQRKRMITKLVMNTTIMGSIVLIVLHLIGKK